MASNKVVISGIAGCFPKCEGLEEFKQALYEKTNLITDLGDWRGEFKVPSHLGRIKTGFDFDHTFLSINFNLANTMDRTAKSLLKEGYSCIMDAGYSPAEVRGSNVGCYMHTSVSDDEMRNATTAFVNGTQFPILVGIARTMHANRISAYFDFHGPSVSHQGSFDSVFNSLKLACEEVASGKQEGALVGSSSLCINPHPSLQFQALGLLTNDPVSRPLDENANGYIRADSTVVFFIQRESDARRSYGQIVNVGVRYFGDHVGTFQSRDEKFIIKLLEDTYRECGLKPSDIGYLETGSWANKNLDTQELNIIRKVFGEGRTDPLPIGSVIGNTGYSEGAAGFVALVKAILAFRMGVIAPTVNVEKPNAVIDEKLKIVTEATPCKDYVGVNVFGLSGGFSHAILKKPDSKPRPKYPLQDDLPRLYFIAARDFDLMDGLFDKLDSTVRSKYLASTMCDVFRREIRGYMARGYAVYPYKNKKIQQAKQYGSNNRPVWLLFSGMGSQWQAMGKDLMKFPVFARAVAKCDSVLKENNVDIMNILTNEEDKTIFDNILNSFVGIACVQIGLVDLLYEMGIKPDGLIGHSVGELGCAYADGALTAEQVIYAAFARGKASKEIDLIKGMMAAVGLGQSQVTPYLPPDIEVACRNSANSCTLSGPAESVEKFVSTLVQKGVFAKTVNVSNIAYHSKYIKPAAPLLLRYLKDVIPNPKERSSKWISTSLEEKDWGSDLAKYASAEYFTNNLLSTVYLEEGAQHIPPNAIVIEIAPHGLLQPIVKKSLGPETINIALTNRSSSVDNVEFLLEAIGQLYLNGLEPDVNAIYPKIDYPIPPNVPSVTQFLTWDFSVKSNLGLTTGARTDWWKNIVLGICSKEKYQHLLNYKIGEKFVVPVAAYIDLLLDFYLKKNPNAKHVTIENFRTYEYDENVFLREKAEISISITKMTGNFEIILERDVNISAFDHPTVIATGCLKSEEESTTNNIPDWKTEIGSLHFDSYLKNLKYSLNENQCVGHLTKYLEGYTGEVLSKGRIFDLVDSCLKVVIIEKSDYKRPEVPYFIQRMIFDIAAIREYKKGRSVQVYYDPLTEQILSSAIVMHKIKTKEFILDNPEPAKDYSGPVSYFASMKYVNLEDIDVKYVGISSEASADETLVDYSGVTLSGNKIMGVVSYLNSMINFDKTLVWNIPESWSLDKAVTVPIVYSMAYLCLIKEKVCYRDDRTCKIVVINGGDTAVGEACIAVALYKKKTVYISVSSEEGRQILLKRFPNLSPNQVFLNTADNFMAIMLDTKGKGANVVVNLVKDEAAMNFCWDALDLNGELIQIGVNEIHSLGMQRFLNSQSFISLNSSVVLNSDEKIKKEIHEFIAEGIENGVIKPIAAKIGSGNMEQKSWDQCDDFSYNVVELNTRQTSHSPTLNLNPDSSYVIVGGYESHHICEWLMQRGARKFVVEFSNEFRATRMSPLLENYGAIVMVSMNNSDTLAGTEALFADARSLGDVAAVFTVNLKGDDCKVKLTNIKKVCDDQKSNAFLASLLCSESSSWHFEIKEESSKSISGILPTLDASLKNVSTYTISSGAKDRIEDNEILTNLQPQQLLDAHLPLQNLQDGYDLYAEISQIDSPTFVEELSQSLWKRYVKDVQPVFFFPGLSLTSMKSFIKKCMYPSYLAHIPAGWSMDDIVAHLCKNLKQIQPRGPYTLVTESWGGIYALKLGEYMEKKGDTVTIILLDASPYFFKDIVKRNQQIFSSEKNLAGYIIKKKDTMILDVQKKSSLELSCKIILDRVKHNVETDVDYKFKAQCALVTSEHSSLNISIQDQYKMFKTISAIRVTDKHTPLQISSDKEVVSFVNDNVAYTWW
ncbi:hypothetical protein M8J75_010956 [Diaphorina citri]|nr:hypothetical protein M8J75_010956 [Diaphorina citri]